MRNILSFILIIFVLLLIPVSTSAYLEEYAPFLKQKPKPFPLSKLNVIEKGDGFVSFGMLRHGKGTPLLKLFESNGSDPFFFLLSIYDASGKAIKESVKVADSSSWRDAYVADLNRDGKKDYAIEISSGGTGLGTYKNFVVLALSSGENYEITTLYNWDSYSIARDFVDLKRNGHCQFIHTSFTYIEGKKGESHSHWAYNLLEIKGTKMIPANHISPEFPKWVWYTIKPNHRSSPFIRRREAMEWAKSKYASFFWEAGKEGAGHE